MRANTKQDRNAEIVKLKNQGWTYRDLSKKFNISSSRVRSIYERDTGTVNYYTKYSSWRKCFEKASLEIVSNTSLGMKLFLLLARNDILERLNNGEIIKDTELMSLDNFGKKSLQVSRKAMVLYRNLKRQQDDLEASRVEFYKNWGYSPDEQSKGV